MEWQPIDIAPRDEVTVQVWCRVSGWVARAWFDDENPRLGWGYCRERNMGDTAAPTEEQVTERREIAR